MITFTNRPEELADFTKSVEDVQGKLVYTVPQGTHRASGRDLHGREQDERRP